MLTCTGGKHTVCSGEYFSSLLDKATGEWVEDNYLFTYLYRGDSEEITEEEEAKALAEKLCPGQNVPFD